MNFTALRCRFKSIIKGNLKLTAWATKLPSCTTKVVSHSVNEKETTVQFKWSWFYFACTGNQIFYFFIHPIALLKSNFEKAKRQNIIILHNKMYRQFVNKAGHFVCLSFTPSKNKY